MKHAQFLIQDFGQRMQHASSHPLWRVGAGHLMKHGLYRDFRMKGTERQIPIL